MSVQGVSGSGKVTVATHPNAQYSAANQKVSQPKQSHASKDTIQISSPGYKTAAQPAKETKTEEHKTQHVAANEGTAQAGSTNLVS